MSKFATILTVIFVLLIYTKADPAKPIKADRIFEMPHWVIVHKVDGGVVALRPDEILRIEETN